MVFLTVTIIIASVAERAWAEPRTAGPVVVLNDDGAWCWFHSPRAVITKAGVLLVSSAAAGTSDDQRTGNIEVARYDLGADPPQPPEVTTLDHTIGSSNDHNAAALVVVDEDPPQVLAVWSGHGTDALVRSSRSVGDDARQWTPVNRFRPDPRGSAVTYSNLARLAAEDGRIYNFFRGPSRWHPSFIFSDDGGRSWDPSSLGVLVGNAWSSGGPSRGHRPYLRYASDSERRVHMIYTEGHPQEYHHTGVYHVYYEGGALWTSNGTRLAALAPKNADGSGGGGGLDHPNMGSQIFAGRADAVAWVTDLVIEPSTGHPVALFTVRVGGGRRADDHRFRLARWDGSAWRVSSPDIAFAGTALYSAQIDYTGLGAIDPGDSRRVVISTDAHPSTGVPLVSATDGRRHYELYLGREQADARWEWTPLTSDSAEDNIRPVVAEWKRGGTGNDQRVVVVTWLRGVYTTYKIFDLEVALMRLDSVSGSLDRPVEDVPAEWTRQA